MLLFATGDKSRYELTYYGSIYAASDALNSLYSYNSSTSPGVFHCCCVPLHSCAPSRSRCRGVPRRHQRLPVDHHQWSQ